MKNNEKTLFIFEGAKTEGKFVRKLESEFLGDRHAVKCVFDTDVYKLYEYLKNEKDFPFDMVSLLKERSEKNATVLKNYNRDSFAYIYLFFDYDCHATMADDEKIKNMLDFFEDETDQGKLYISYPMVEAIRHFKDMDSFKNLTIECKGGNCKYINECNDKQQCMNKPHYKNISTKDSNSKLQYIGSYTNEVWQTLIKAHLFKANYLVNDNFVFPTELISQANIFSKQIEKHISIKCPKVAVLSALPLYVFDYFGIEETKKRLDLSSI